MSLTINFLCTLLIRFVGSQERTLEQMSQINTLNQIKNRYGSVKLELNPDIEKHWRYPNR